MTSYRVSAGTSTTSMTSLIRPSLGSKNNAADNECAQALLQLAMSASSNSDHHILHRRPSSSSSLSSLSPASRQQRSSSSTVSACSASRQEVISSSPSQEYGSGFSEDQGLNEYREEIVKRVKLDHNYAWPWDGKAKPAEYTEAYNFAANMQASDSLLEEILGDDVGIPPRWNKENAYDQPRFYPRKSPNKKGRPYGSSPKRYTNACVNMVNKQQNCELYPQASATASISTTTTTHTENKYSKFQLLMKCLIANDPGEEKMALDSLSNLEVTPPVKAEITNVPSTTSDEDDDDDSGHMVDVCSDADGDCQYVCPECPKTFSKKRYLTKHVRRMHPEADLPEVKDEIATACPNCFRVISRKNFRRHLMVCDAEMRRSKNKHYTESDQAFCQFCGVQMKRHLLVKHLAKEHCIDRHTIQYDQEFSKFLADEENASMYPSETSYPMRETSHTFSAINTVVVDDTKRVDVSAMIVACPKCGVSMNDELLSRHMALEHEIHIEAEAVSSRCSCKHSMLQAYLDGSGENSLSSGIGNYPCEACVQNLSTLSEQCSATVSARSSDCPALSSPLSGISNTSPVKSTRGSSSTVSAEETRQQVSLLEETARAMLTCASNPIESINCIA